MTQDTLIVAETEIVNPHGKVVLKLDYDGDALDQEALQAILDDVSPASLKHFLCAVAHECDECDEFTTEPLSLTFSLGENKVTLEVTLTMNRKVPQELLHLIVAELVFPDIVRTAIAKKRVDVENETGISASKANSPRSVSVIEVIAMGGPIGGMMGFRL